MHTPSSTGETSPNSPGVALVTGAMGIIGPGICQVLQDAGYQVAAHARNPAKAQRSRALREKITQKPFPASEFFHADLSDPAASAALVTQVESKLGPISLLVNNAVTNAASTPLEACTIEYTQTMLNVNVLTPIQLARAAMKSLEQTQGSVINISSIAVHWMWDGSLMYAVSKAALEQATRSMASELGKLEVRANTIRLGSVPSDELLLDVVEKLPAELAPRFYQEMMQRRRQMPAGRQALRHGGTPEDVGALIAFLASSAARFITGATITLDGGMDLVMSPGSVPVEKTMDQYISEWLAAHAPRLSVMQ